MTKFDGDFRSKYILIDYAKLERLAAKRDTPLSTYAYELLSGALRRER